MSRSWHQVRYDLYQSLRTQCERILGYTDREISRYQKDYRKDIEREWSESTVQSLIRATHGAQLILMGDFHALYQSQKGHLRVLRLLPRRRPKILFVEFIAAKNQAILDAYLRQEITDAQFLKAVKWKESWGFSWRSYKPILVWARKRKVQVIALDKALKVHGDQSLQERDSFASELILKHMDKCPNYLGIVIVGDYHISRNHLPKQIEARQGRSSQILRIFQNSENIYFELANQGREYEVDVIQFAERDFCLISVAPWVKWHSLLMHLESQIYGDSELLHQIQEEVLRFYRVLKSDLNTLALDEDFEVASLNDPVARGKMEKFLDESEIGYADLYIKLGLSFYIPKLKMVFVSKISLNYAAEAAMAVWHAKVTQNDSFFYDESQSFYKLVWSFLIIYYGSKLLNPKRKTDTLYDIRLHLKNSKSESRVFRQIVKLKALEWLWLNGSKSHTKSACLFKTSLPKQNQVQIARALGAMAGEKLYYIYRRRLLKNDQVLDYLQASSDQWPDCYFRLIAEMERFPDPFFSKRLKI